MRPETGEEPQSVGAYRRVTYTFSSSSEHQNDTGSISLPSKSFIGHLAQVIDFHLNTTHFLFDLVALQGEIERTSLPPVSALKHTKLLAIVATGKLLLEKGATTFGPPGIREFLHAVHILPSNLLLHQDSQLAIETLVLLAIYAQAADLHAAAYLYVRLFPGAFTILLLTPAQIGQAQRLGRYIKLWKQKHTSSNTNSPPPSDTTKLWWTICLLETRMASTVGISPEYQPHSRDGHSISLEAVQNNMRGAALRAHLYGINLMSKSTSGKHAKYIYPPSPA